MFPFNRESNVKKGKKEGRGGKNGGRERETVGSTQKMLYTKTKKKQQS